VVETSAGNFQAWLKHSKMFPKLLGTFAAQTLAERYDADPSAADWRRFGRLPGFTNCKPKYRKSDGLFPFVRLHSHSGQQYPMAEAFEQEITTLYEVREQERESRRLQRSLSPHRDTVGEFRRSRSSFRTADFAGTSEITSGDAPTRKERSARSLARQADRMCIWDMLEHRSKGATLAPVEANAVPARAGDFPAD
jgi:RepB DNA-primase from phage plasmid